MKKCITRKYKSDTFFCHFWLLNTSDCRGAHLFTIVPQCRPEWPTRMEIMHWSILVDWPLDEVSWLVIDSCLNFHFCIEFDVWMMSSPRSCSCTLVCAPWSPRVPWSFMGALVSWGCPGPPRPLWSNLGALVQRGCPDPLRAPLSLFRAAKICMGSGIRLIE